MPKKLKPQEILQNIYVDSNSSTAIDKTYSILTALRSGKFYNSSNARRHLLAEYKTLFTTLNSKEHENVKNYLISEIDELIKDRMNCRVAYQTLADIIEYSSQKDLGVYCAYESAVKFMTSDGKTKHIQYLFGAMTIKHKLTEDISDLEDFYIQKFIHIHKWYMNWSNLMQLAWNVPCADRRKLLEYLCASKPFSSDEHIIRTFVRCFPELERHLILL